MRLVSDRLTGRLADVSCYPDTRGRRTPPLGPHCPRGRGPLSATVLAALRRSPGSLGQTPRVLPVDALSDDDLHLALYLCYELHYRGLAGADAEWEWDPALLCFRAQLERAFLRRLVEEVDPLRRVEPGDVRDALTELIANAAGPSLSGFLLESGKLVEVQEFCVHRSAYQLKEADPHTFAIPRLSGEAKATMVEIQHDEYGSGVAGEMHSALFAATMTALGLDPTYGAYLDQIPGVTLATVNLVSMFGLHRRWRAALVGHLAVFELTSVKPMARYSQALARMGVGAQGRRFYDVHVAADARHGAIALDRMVAGLIGVEPQLGADLLFGAAALLLLEQSFAGHLLGAWAHGRSSLIGPGADPSQRVPEQGRGAGVASPATLPLASGSRDLVAGSP